MITTVSVFVGLSTGLISAVAVLYFQRQHRSQTLYRYYSRIEGKYKRIDIGQDNTDEKQNSAIIDQNVGLPVELIYIGENAFSVIADYWKNENSQVSAVIEFNEANKMVANGRYHYTRGKSFNGHFGTYTVYRFEENDNKLLVLYHHVFPRLQVYNPDNNRGWEIWEKV